MQGAHLEQTFRITKTLQVEVGLKTDDTKPNTESEVELGCIQISLKGSVGLRWLSCVLSFVFMS